VIRITLLAVVALAGVLSLPVDSEAAHRRPRGSSVVVRAPRTTVIVNSRPSRFRSSRVSVFVR
jgi:hypothetical protein